jgi:hypothetical protein
MKNNTALGSLKFIGKYGKLVVLKSRKIIILQYIVIYKKEILFKYYFDYKKLPYNFVKKTFVKG